MQTNKNYSILTSVSYEKKLYLLSALLVQRNLSNEHHIFSPTKMKISQSD